MQTYRRTTCRLCDSSNVELVVKLAPIPMAENYCSSSEEGKNAPLFPVDVYMCSDCGHVQQLDVIDVQSLWSNYTYHSGMAKGMLKHFQEVYAGICRDFQFPQGSLIVDIGSNDGSLLRPFRDAGHQVLGVDPAQNIASYATSKGIPTIAQSMSSALAQQIVQKYGKAHVVCMFNAFAHMDNLRDILLSVRILLHSQGLFVFESQYLADIIDKKLIATIFHEHMSHHSLCALAKFFESCDMELVDVRRASIQHGSIIGVVQHRGGAHPVRSTVKSLLCMERERSLDKLCTLRAFAADIADMRRRITAWSTECRSQGAHVAGFGAARSGPTLIAQLGLEGIIEYIFDDHPQKVGFYTSGEGTPIVPSRELYARMPTYTVVLAWVHAEKIIETHRRYLDKGGSFVVLCPEPRIVSREGEQPL